MKKLFELLGIAIVLVVAGSSWGESFERILYLKGGNFVSASTAGDVNGDGYDDLITNIPDGTGNGHQGGPCIYLGPTPDSFADIILSSPLFDEYVFTAGDVNGDGYSDVMAWGMFRTPPYPYAAYLYLGNAPMDTVADIIFMDTLDNPLRAFPCPIGDFNGDGYDDIAIPFQNGSDWFTGIYFGDVSMDTIRDLVILGKPTVLEYPYYPSPVELDGDINGDGYSDIIIVRQDTLNRKDTLYIYYGDSIPDSTSDAFIVVDSVSDFSMAGDINGDGYSDIVIACGPAETHIFLGGNSFDTTTDIILPFGFKVSYAGDVNGDGFDDILIYTYGKNYLFFGSDPMDIQSDWQQNTCGGVLGTAGDLNNDGYDEFLTGKYPRTGHHYESPPYIEVWQCNVGIEEGKNSTPEYRLSVSPNPFVQSTTLEYSLTHPSSVSLRIYDISGTLVRTLIEDETKNAGKYEIVWDGNDNRDVNLPSGLYFCRFKTTKTTVTKKFIIIN